MHLEHSASQTERRSGQFHHVWRKFFLEKNQLYSSNTSSSYKLTPGDMAESMKATGNVDSIEHSNKDTIANVTAVNSNLQRKRGRSVREGSLSPEMSKQLLEARKKAKVGKKDGNERKTRMERKSQTKPLNEHCVFCSKTGSTINMVQCEM